MVQPIFLGVLLLEICTQCEDEVDTEDEVSILEDFEDPSTAMDYQVKVINPDNKSGSEVKSMTAKKFNSPEEVEDALETTFPTYTCAGNFQYGFIAPGHGFKGKQLPLSCDADLRAMYTHYSGKAAKLWLKCVKASQKRSRLSVDDDQPSPKRTAGNASATKRRAGPGFDSHLKKMEESEVIYDKLHKKHSKTYSDDQIRAWAHLIRMKRHSSYEEAPGKKYFKLKGDDLKKVGISPSKRVNLRSECITQLDKWHSLFERGVVTSEQYDDLQKSILSDITKFN